MSLTKQYFKYVSQNIFGLLGTSCYILADTYFISQAAGTSGVALLNLCLPIYNFIFAIGSMLGLGAATRYAILRAQGDERSERYFSNALLWALVFALPFMLAGIFCPEVLLRFMGGDAEIVALGVGYARIFLLFTPFFMCNYIVASFVRNDGDPSLAMVATLCGSLFNVVFDYIFMFPMGLGLPGAALAMYQCAKPEKKKVAGGLLLSAALTAFLTGITEPLEFTFIFVALPMYAVHCVLAGLSFMLMHILNVGVGMTFSGGLIDLVLFGVMQGNAKTHWVWVVVVGAVYFVLYYIIFRFMISKFDYKTPGRDDAEEVKLYTRADVNARSAASGSTAPAGDDPVSALIVEGLGGTNNLSDVDCCATRLRCTVKDAALVKQDVLKASGASGVICKGNGVQVVYGPKVAVIKAKLEDYLENAPKTPAATAAPAPATAPATPAAAAKDTVLSACLNGTVVPLADVKDEAFASGALGDGIAIEPTDGELVAPADGEISSTFETHHAVGMTTADGAELLMHIGIDTVKLGGKHFTYLVNEGDKVKKGQPLIRFELEAIKAEGYPVTTPLIVCNTDDYAAVAAKASGAVKQGDALLELKH